MIIPMDSEDQENYFNELRAYVKRFVIGLAYGTPLAEDVCSSFIMEVGGEWFLVTAGHVVEALKQKAHLAGASFRCELFDAWEPELRQEPVPVPFVPDEWGCHNNDELGIDVGFTRLSPLIRQALEVNKIMALTSKEWGGAIKGWPDYMLVGLPESYIYKKGRNSLNLAIQWINGIKECEGTEALRKEAKRFYGKLPSNFDGSVKGMSGGPIFGFATYEDCTEIGLVAIQAGWDKEARVIAGNYGLPLGLVLEKVIEVARLQPTPTPQRPT